jgi:hypothetical protein
MTPKPVPKPAPKQAPPIFSEFFKLEKIWDFLIEK